ncbi:PREDICTED: uncharacterized protein LOC106741984 isoform X2 [Dinoponera quadriceps]|nr:PREDICTED: uncharacterized protein LOC106741984 isoform X2 [Dinoponera quadriceps]
MTRLAWLLRETFPTKLKAHTCTLNMLGKCMWNCLTCGTAPRDMSTPVCKKCYVMLMQGNIVVLRCGHAYCKYCLDTISMQIKNSIPVYLCEQCNQWKSVAVSD